MRLAEYDFSVDQPNDGLNKRDHYAPPIFESVLAGSANESSISKTPSRSRPTRTPSESTCALSAVVGGAARSVYDGAAGVGRISVECFIIFRNT
jgi:hypothetical protein